LDSPTTKIMGLVFYCRRTHLPKPFSPLILFKHTAHSSANLWSRIRSRFWGSPYGLAYSQALSQEQMQEALVELSFVDGAFMLHQHQSHGPDYILLNFVLNFAERLASSMSLETQPGQLKTAARLNDLIRRLTAGHGIEEEKKEVNFGLKADLPNRCFEIVTSALDVEATSVVNLIASLQTRSPAHSKMSVVVAETTVPPRLVGICNVTLLPQLLGSGGIQRNNQRSGLSSTMSANHNEVSGSILSALLALSTALKATECALWLHPSLEAQAPLHDLMHFLSGPIFPVLLPTDEEDTEPLRCSVRGSKVPFTASKRIFAACKGNSFESTSQNIRDCWERPDCASSLSEARLERALCEMWQDQPSAVANEQMSIGMSLLADQGFLGRMCQDTHFLL